MDFTIGADPEFSLKKNGKYVSAYGIVPGTKLSPYPCPGGAMQVDGMAVEFNINPASNSVEFNTNIVNVLDSIRSKVGVEYDFAFDPVAVFDEDYIKDQPPEARELGCDPDLNAYTGLENPNPSGNLEFIKTKRTQAGHIHIGWMNNMNVGDKGHIEACVMLTKQLDYVFDIMSIIWDDDCERQQLYGKKGAFRVKPYGVEYRSLSNAWVSNPIHRDLVFKITNLATLALLNSNNYSKRMKPVVNGNAFCYNNKKWLTSLTLPRISEIIDLLNSNAKSIEDNLDYGHIISLLNQRIVEDARLYKKIVGRTSIFPRSLVNYYNSINKNATL